MQKLQSEMEFLSRSFTSFLMIFSVSLFTTFPSSSSTSNLDNFIHCISLHSLINDTISPLIHTPTTSSYTSVLHSTLQNLRFSSAATAKPLLILTPSQPSHVQAAAVCSKNHGLQIRTRSGGHDFEGLSFVSDVPFILIDLANLRSITVDTENDTAWVESGATIGELYYRIGEKSRRLGFPAGVSPTVGIGGFLSGGGYGMMVRKYGLAADHVIDAELVDANGRLLDRKSMGEDLFWAIRGGGGGSFGIVLRWKIKLFTVPPIVTVFTVSKAWDSNSTKLVHQWQYVAPHIDENLFIGVILSAATNPTDGERMMGVYFYSLFLGTADELLPILQEGFPELGLTKQDCFELSWIEAMAYPRNAFIPTKNLELLLDRTPITSGRFKIKSDFLKQPIPETGLAAICQRFRSGEPESAQLILIPYGGNMNHISETETPSPHRAGYLIKMAYYISWADEDDDAEARHVAWTRELYDFMGGFVSNSPRAAYVNYRDLDIGMNEKYGRFTSYEKARVWGVKYFGGNFERLVRVKTRVDPYNFFQHEQSIPSLGPWMDTQMGNIYETFPVCYNAVSV